MKRLLVLLVACAHPTPRDYELGRGVARDYSRALDGWQRACAHGDGAACMNASYALANGRGAPVDADASRAAMSAGCRAGDASACVLADLDSPGRRVDVRHEVAARDRCKAGDGEACYAQLVLQLSHRIDCDGGDCDNDVFAFAHTCALGAWRGCEAATQIAFEACGDDACAQAAEAKIQAPEVKAAIAQVRAACDLGDAEACGYLPGRALDDATLCAEHDFAACQP